MLNGICGFAPQGVCHTAVELQNFLLGKCVLKALHLHLVGNAPEGVKNNSADFLRRGVGRYLVRVLSLVIEQTAHKCVVLGVGNLRVVENVISL